IRSLLNVLRAQDIESQPRLEGERSAPGRRPCRPQTRAGPLARLPTPCPWLVPGFHPWLS
ncbi:MAG: hypothetical protein ACK535_06940, partial [Cyanobacteriota bacterium]